MAFNMPPVANFQPLSAAGVNYVGSGMQRNAAGQAVPYRNPNSPGTGLHPLFTGNLPGGGHLQFNQVPGGTGGYFDPRAVPGSQAAGRTAPGYATPSMDASNQWQQAMNNMAGGQTNYNYAAATANPGGQNMQSGNQAANGMLGLLGSTMSGFNPGSQYYNYNMGMGNLNNAMQQIQPNYNSGGTGMGVNPNYYDVLSAGNQAYQNYNINPQYYANQAGLGSPSNPIPL